MHTNNTTIGQRLAAIFAGLRCRHDYGFPRRRNGRDIQTCLHCGDTRISRIQFGGASCR